jgi:hypothetical protein
VIDGTDSRRRHGEVSGVVPDELSTDPVERRRYNAPASFGLGVEQLHLAVCRIEVEIGAQPAAVRQHSVFAVPVPVRDLDPEILLKVRHLADRECLRRRHDTPDRKTAEKVLTYQVNECHQGTRIDVKEERRQGTDPPAKPAQLPFRRCAR